MGSVIIDSDVDLDCFVSWFLEAVLQGLGFRDLLDDLAVLMLAPGGELAGFVEGGVVG